MNIKLMIIYIYLYKNEIFWQMKKKLLLKHGML